MKNAIVLLIGLLLAGPILAQTNNNNPSAQPQKPSQETIFKKPTHVGWYIAPEFGYTRFDNRDVTLGGLSAGVIFNHHFSIGFSGFGIMNSLSLSYENVVPDTSLLLCGGYGGLRLEYRINPAKKVNISFPLTIGGGSMTLVKENSWNNSHYNSINDYSYGWDTYFVLEPGVMAGFNLLKWMRLDAGVSYRYAPGIHIEPLPADFNSFNGVVSLKFGMF